MVVKVVCMLHVTLYRIETWPIRMDALACYKYHVTSLSDTSARTMRVLRNELFGNLFWRIWTWRRLFAKERSSCFMSRYRYSAVQHY